MSRRPGLPGSRRFAAAAALAAIAGCRAPSAASSAPPRAMPVVAASPLAEPPAPVARDTAGAPQEQRMTLTGEWDVRLALEEIAKSAGYSLIVSPRIPAKKVRLSIVNVPASQALAAVLDAADLTLEPARGPAPPWNPSVVFYQVPVNVDSLSAEAIMKRFGVSRDIANLVVAARRPE